MEKTEMSDTTGPFTRFVNGHNHRLLKGELWLGTAALDAAGLDDDVPGHLALRRQMSMDFFFLPVHPVSPDNPTQGYRYFNLDELTKAVRESGLFTGAILDGPFQRLADRMGLMPFLMAWKSDRQSVAAGISEEAEQILDLAGRAAQTGAGAVVVADDLAWDGGPYIHPDEIREMLAPFYTRAAALIRSLGSSPLIHSCGNITSLIPMLVTAGFEGLAGCQGRCVDIDAVRGEHPLILMTGIDPEYLQKDEMTADEALAFEGKVRDMVHQGGFVLTSSCGLYEGGFPRRLEGLYHLAEKAAG